MGTRLGVGLELSQGGSIFDRKLPTKFPGRLPVDPTNVKYDERGTERVLKNADIQVRLPDMTLA